MTRIAYYTSGTIGGGHLVQGLAIAAGLERAGVDCEYRIFAAAGGVPLPRAAMSDVVALPDERRDLRDADGARESVLAAELAEFAPDVLLVDIAWIDLRHLLPLPGAEAWLLLRWIPKQFLRGPFNRSFREEVWARIIATEPIVPFDTPESVEPVVICNPDECRAPGELRKRLDVQSEQPITLVVQAGLPGECEQLVERERARGDGHRVVSTSLHEPDPIFPIAPWLPGADRIVGGAGYNLYWETRWLGVADKTELTAFPRRIDDQTPRLRLAGSHRMLANGADQLAARLA